MNTSTGDCMQASEASPPTSPVPRKGIATLLLCLATGALSGALVAVGVMMVEWSGGSRPDPIRFNSAATDPALRWVKMGLLEYALYLTQFLVKDALAGAFWGLFGGVFTAAVLLYRRRPIGLCSGALIWAVMGSLVIGCAWLISIGLDHLDGHALWVPVAPTTAAAVVIVCATFGALQAFLIRLLPLLHGAGRSSEGVATALLPAWLRLVIYIPCAEALTLLGSIVASLTVSDESLIATPDGGVQSVSPGALVFFAYSNYLLVVPFTLWFARQYDRRTWREIGLSVAPRPARDLLLGGILAGSIVGVWTAGLAVLRLVSIHRTEVSAWEAIAYGVIFCSAVGFSEEVIFRGYLLPNLMEAVGRSPAIWLSAILFWADHWSRPAAMEPLGAIGLVLFGVLFALCYLATNSLWLPIGLHAGYDFLCLSIFQSPAPLRLPSIYVSQYHGPLWLIGEPGRTGLAGVLFMLVVVGVVYRWLYRPAMLSRREDSARTQVSMVQTGRDGCPEAE